MKEVGLQADMGFGPTCGLRLRVFAKSCCRGAAEMTSASSCATPELHSWGVRLGFVVFRVLGSLGFVVNVLGID